MPPRRGVTIILLESSPAPPFTLRLGFLPETSMVPWLRAFSTYLDAPLITRQIRSREDLRCWCEALNGACLGCRVLWLSGHGQPSHEPTRVVDLSMPSYRRFPEGNRIPPDVVKREVERTGSLNGLIVDGCRFATNPPASWLPNNATWALAFDQDVEWLDSLFFCLKVVGWIFDDAHGPPPNGQVALRRYRSGLSTGRSRTPPTNYTELASGLGARFYWKDRGWNEITPTKEEETWTKTRG
jgi:hypothetical protein